MAAQDEGRLLIVSNRLPFAARVVGGRVRLAASSGGLAVGLRPFHSQGARGGLWIGWPGDVARWTPEQRTELDACLRERAIVPVYLSREHVERYYHGFANRVLWPLFHYLIDRVPVDAAGWDAYKAVNEAFADAVVREHRAGDTIWIHDYQLMLVPALIRDRLPRARVGFFLHVPFPSSEVFRTLPWRSQILHGLLGADLIGFHTFAYMRHLVASLLHVEGVEPDIDRVRVGDRDVHLGVFPMGVDAGHFSELSRSPEVIARAAAIREDAGGRRILLGVDRLDYTKGIPRRLHAIERLLERDPGLGDRIRYIQVAVPSRAEVDSYQSFKRQVEEAVGRINGARGTLRSTPVHYMHRSVGPAELVALYSAADVMLVTPLRDGMNLVAKEFVSARSDGDGVLILSEFAGAAAELDGALVVNPYDVDGVADAVQRALHMPEAERAARMASLRSQVMGHDVHAWARSFLDRLASVRPSAPAEDPSLQPPLLAVVARAAARTMRLLLDYDGTLTPIVRDPELAAPDDELLRLLRGVAATPGIRLDIVSGRTRETLEGWLGDLQATLWAEHGFWRRAAPGEPWIAAGPIPPALMERTRPILEQFTASTPGSHIETKSASIAWHYRRAQRDFGARQAHELRMLLGEALSNQPFEVLEGKKVIEIRVRGVSKAIVARRVLEETTADTLIVAAGDDHTDEHLLAALPPEAVTIAVGPVPAGARFRVEDYRAVRQIVRALADYRSASPAQPATSVASVTGRPTRK